MDFGITPDYYDVSAYIPSLPDEQEDELADSPVCADSFFAAHDKSQGEPEITNQREVLAKLLCSLIEEGGVLGHIDYINVHAVQFLPFLKDFVNKNTIILASTLEKAVNRADYFHFTAIFNLINPFITDDSLGSVTSFQAELLLENPFKDTTSNWLKELGRQNFKIVEGDLGTAIYVKTTFNNVYKYFTHKTGFNEEQKVELIGLFTDIIKTGYSQHYLHYQNTVIHSVNTIEEMREMFKLGLKELKDKTSNTTIAGLTQYLRAGLPGSFAKIRIIVQQLNLSQAQLEDIFSQTIDIPSVVSVVHKFNYYVSDHLGYRYLPYFIALAISPLIENRKCKNNDISTLFQYAVQCNDVDTLRYLFLDPKLLDKMIDACDNSSYDVEIYRNPIARALSQGCLDTALTLLRSGFPIDHTVRVKHETIKRQNGKLTKYINYIRSNAISKLFYLIRGCEYVSKIDYANICNFLEIALIAGVSPDHKMITSTNGEIDQTILEFCYFNRNKNPSLFTDLCVLLLDRGATITDRMAISMRMEIEAKHEKTFIDYMVNQKRLTAQEAQLLLMPKTSVMCRPEEYCRHLITKITVLQKLNYQFGTNPLHADLKYIREIREFKKNIKQFLEKADKKHPDVMKLENLYQDMVRHYDHFVESHIYLKELRKASYDLRKKRILSRQHDNLYSLWSRDNSYGRNDAIIRVNQLLDPKLRPKLWSELYVRQTQALDKLNKVRYLQQYAITWITGTKLSPGMYKVGALLIASELFAKGVPNFNGQFSGTEKSINEKNISGSILSKFFGESGEGRSSLLYDANTRALISYLYAIKRDGYSDEMVFDPEKSWTRINVAYLKELIDKGPPQSQEHESLWSKLKIDIIRLRFTDPEADKKLKDLKIYIELLLQKPHSHTDKLKEVLNSLNITLTFTLDAKDLELTKNPYPVIFASTSIHPVPSAENIPKQYFAAGSQKLGTDIQVAFTLEKYMDQVKGFLEPLGILVLDMDVLFALETLNMIKHEEDKQPLSFIDHVSKVIDRDIRPWYEMPLPSLPTYLPEGQTKKEPYPEPIYTQGMNYEQYLKSAEDGAIPYREIHDTLHMARTPLIALQLVNLFSKLCKRPPIKNKDHFLVGVSGHDGARDLDINRAGKDPWEHDSAMMLRALFIQNGLDKDTIDRLVYMLLYKDPENEDFKTDEQRIMHDSDCLEITRLISKDQFRKKELCFYKMDFPGVTQEFKDKYIEEVISFIKRTEHPVVKKQLRNTPNIFKALYDLVTADDYPIMFSLLKE
jgi:hypothetical protein